MAKVRRRSIPLALCIALLGCVGCSATSFSGPGRTEDEISQRSYTAQNLWRQRRNRLTCINYKTGTLIPAGTEVSNVGLVDERTPSDADPGPFSPDDPEFDLDTAEIRFKRNSDGKEFRIVMRNQFHPGKTIRDCLHYVFTNKTFEELTHGLTDKEVKAIRAGILVEGMTKRAVLISYGAPPGHHTPDLGAKAWYYWMSRLGRKEICFDENDLTIRCNSDIGDVL